MHSLKNQALKLVSTFLSRHMLCEYFDTNLTTVVLKVFSGEANIS